MKRIQTFILFASIVFYAPSLFAQYTGGDNDGFNSNIGCIQNLNGTSGLIASAIAGSSEFCAFATEAYSISVSGTTSSTLFVWSVPSGATITSGQGTNSILVTFGNVNGNISVDVSNECTLVNDILPVTSSSCTFFTGGNNDGSTTNIGCIANLNGGSAFIPGPIVGSTQFCSFATEAYTITVAGSTSSTVYNWSVPVGATITSGQGTNSILVTFGGANGNVSVDISNECELINVALPVTAASCTFFAGGSNDGFSSNIGCIANLNGGSAFIPGPIVGSTQFCSFATEAYTITVAGATSSTVYVWSVPAGATVTSGQGTNTVLITFGGANGNVSVDISNECELINVALPVTTASCTFFAGGSNDGFSTNIGCIENLNGGSAFIPGPIVGSTQFCSFATEAYTITVAGATSSTVYVWSVPAGATVTSGQGTNSVLITFGGSNGNVSVDISNECETINVSLPVTSSSCVFFAGGNNDGFSSNIGCIANLNGGSSFVPGPIVGSSQFCSFATEAYTITVAGATSSTVYVWSVPSGATITSGQGTNTILVTFGGTNGNVSVDVSNECATVNTAIAVNSTSCVFYAGGSGDGFSVTRSNVNIPLPIELISFIAKKAGTYVELAWATASELNNDFFTIERSVDAEHFEEVSKMKGNGTTHTKNTYVIIDKTPYAGLSYYRLKQTDFDRLFTYSPLVSIEMDIDLSLNLILNFDLFPNPNNGDQFSIILNKVWNDKSGKIEINDLTGKSVFIKEIVCRPDLLIEPRSGSAITSGVYFITLTIGNHRSVKKLIVQ